MQPDAQTAKKEWDHRAANLQDYPWRKVNHVLKIGAAGEEFLDIKNRVSFERSIVKRTAAQKNPT